MTLIQPHGGKLVARVVSEDARHELGRLAQGLESVSLEPWEVADLEMIASGALSPLTGFMVKKDYDTVLEDLRLDNGLPWSLPVTLRTDTAPSSKRLALRDGGGALLGVLDVADVFAADREREARLVYGTTSAEHPGVARLLASGGMAVGGEVLLLQRSTPEFPDLALDPVDTRRIFEERGWKTVVGFQTRNPIHRAHEYIQKAAMETVDGLLLHPLVGSTKGDDIPAAVRVRSYRVLLDGYYPKENVLLAAFPAAMRYAGPREAVWHAIARKNYGCSHFIVGRDHAGVGNYYGTYDAQRIFDRFGKEEIGITIVPFEHTFFCRVCDGMASRKTCPHGGDNHVALSGTKVRDLLRAGVLLPGEFSRAEVAEVLLEGLQQQHGGA